MSDSSLKRLTIIGRQLGVSLAADRTEVLSLNDCSQSFSPEKLADFISGGYSLAKGKVYKFFDGRPDLETPVEISKTDHRNLAFLQLVGMVRDGGIRPMEALVQDPAKYFAILEAVGNIDLSLAIKMGVQYR